MRAHAIGIAAFLAACGGGAQLAEAPRKPSPVVPPAQAKAPASRASSGRLSRKDVSAWIDAGFAQFLRRVVVQPRLVDGQFRGWTIVELRPADFWAGVDLKPGDVVLSVNDLPIERETEAYDAFESLRKADRLLVALERGGEPRMLQFRIVPETDAARAAPPAR